MADQEYEHGTMEVSNQERVFVGFVKMSIWVGAISIGALIFLALVNG